MKIIDVQQSSLAWLQARAGVVTASEVDALISPLFKARTGDGVKSYLAQKLAEKWVGGPIADFCSIDMEFGKILEEEAIPRVEMDLNQDITRVGFITSDTGEIGCSPDGLFGDNGGIEIKCPQAKTHIGYLLESEIPKQYMAQIQFSLFVTGRKWWKFVSYHRKMPMLVKTVEPDPKAFAAFDEAVNDFLERMREGWDKLVELNGGKEPTRKTFTNAEPITEDAGFGITP